MITVLVTVENGTISEIEITSADGEDKAYLCMAEDIIPKIIEAQSADVDTVSMDPCGNTVIVFCIFPVSVHGCIFRCEIYCRTDGNGCTD